MINVNFILQYKQKILYSNLEDVLVAVDSIDDSEIGLPDLLQQIKEVKTEQHSKQEKRKIIANGLIKYPKIKRRYLRSYP